MRHNKKNKIRLRCWLYNLPLFRYFCLPTISVVIPVYKIDPEILQKTIDSVINQTYKKWQLCLSNSSSQPAIRVLLDLYQKQDSRIKIKHLKKNYGIAENSNKALELATGKFIAFMDHDDELAPEALDEVVKMLQTDPKLEIIYTDQDYVNTDSTHYYGSVSKPDWDLEQLLVTHYVCHLLVIKRRLVKKLGGLRSQFDGAQDYDLILRASELTEKIGHLPKVLYHWRALPSSLASTAEAKPYSWTKGLEALAEAKKRRGIT